MSVALYDEARVRRAIGLLVQTGDVFEIRAIGARFGNQWGGKKVVSGFFNDGDKAITALAAINAAKSIYVTLNPVDASLLARCCNRLDYVESNETTADKNILCRRWLLIDCDPDRPAGISATTPELLAACKRAEEILSYLSSVGFPLPVKAPSGNGAHLLYRVDLPAEDGGLIKNCLAALSAKFSGDGIKVDETVFNSSRITKLYGTKACKGDDVPDRPHRLSEIGSVPDPLEVVPVAVLNSLAASAPATAAPLKSPAKKSGLPIASGKTFLTDFIARHGIEITRQHANGSSQVYTLAGCPFDASHGARGEVAILEQADGTLGFKCQHDSCSGNHWREFRAHYEPGCFGNVGANVDAERDAASRASADEGAQQDFRKKLNDEQDIRAALAAILFNDHLTGMEQKQLVADTVVAHLIRKGRFFFHAQHRDYATAMYFDGGTKRLLRVQADEFLAGIAEWTGINRSNQYFKFIQSKIEDESIAGHSTTGIIPESYWASRTGTIYLSTGDGSMAKISGDETVGTVNIVDNGTDGVLFPAGSTLPPWQLTEPVDPFATCRLFQGVNVSGEHGRTLLKLWLLSLPTNPICKPPLVATGEPGSGKTRTIRGMAELYGLPFMSTTPKSGEKSQSDFWVSLDAGGLFTLDNADTRVDWLADAVSTATTGAGDHRRKLYSDKETQEFKPNAWLALTAANPIFARDPALADRVLVVRLNRRTGETDDAALSAEIAHHRDAGLSWIARMLAAALADTAETPKSLNKRHPDFAAFAVKLGRAMGCEAEVVAALTAAEEDKSRFNLENDPLGAVIIKLISLEPNGFSGTSAELLAKLAAVEADEFGEDNQTRGGKRFWTAAKLGTRLGTIWCHVEALFAARRERDSHTKTQIYVISPKVAGGAEGVPPQNGKVLIQSLMGDFPRNSPQPPAASAEPDLGSLAAAPEPDAIGAWAARYEGVATKSPGLFD